MAEDNPFLGFFESMGVGMEAGAERRSLMERARLGKLEPGESVPSLGRTILQGITKAATPASTRLAQDELKLRAANQALDYKIQQDRQTALDVKASYEKAKEAAEAKAELQDSLVYAESINKMGQFLVNRDVVGLQRFNIPSDISESTARNILAAKQDLLNGERAKRLFEMKDMREVLAANEIPPDKIPTDYNSLKREMDRITSMEEQEIAEKKAEQVMSKAAEAGAESVTINLGGGNQFTYKPVKKEEADGYTQVQLADRLMDANVAVSRAKSSREATPEYLELLYDNLEMLSALARSKGWSSIIPGPRDQSPTPVTSADPLWEDFLRANNAFVK